MVMLSQQLHAKIIELGNNSPDKEICGIIIGHESGNYAMDVLYEIPNVSTGLQLVEFEMDPTAVFKVLSQTKLINKNSQMVFKATFHSHPSGLPVPSSIDYKNLQYDIPHFIYGMSLKGLRNCIRAWKYNHNIKYFDELKIQLMK